MTLRLFFILYRVAYKLAELISFIGLNQKLHDYFSLRKNSIKLSTSEKSILFHCASMGEYETIKPVARALKKNNPATRLTVSFFSSSGFDHAADPDLFDHKVYSPLEYQSSIQQWLEVINPQLIIMSENEVWPIFLKVTTDKNIPIIYAGCHFENNIKTKVLLYLLNPLLSNVNHFFVEKKSHEPPS